MRIRRSLNFNWRFTPDYQDAYLKPDFDPAKFESVMLPHSLIELPFNYINDETHQFVGTYFLDFTIDKPDKSQMMFLRFYGVMNTCTVYLNGKEIGSHKGGYTPFDMVLEDDLILDQTNRLVVVVDGRETANIPPFGGVVDYLGHSGIYREVELQIIPKTHIRHLRIKPFEPSSLMESQIVINYEFDLDGPLLFPLEAKVVVSDQDKTIHQDTNIFKKGDQLAGGFLLDDICRWSPESPKLYHLELSLSHDGKIIDSVKERFGCRTIKFTPEGFTINNHRLKLIGLNRHQSYPYVGYAMPKRMQELDAEILRNELGVNIVRTSHYMQSDHFIARADELGLLVFEEIPGWQHLGDEEFKTLSLANLKTMINHHFNHPSIIMWGVRINESQDDNTFYLETNRIARELDETRPTGGVRNFAGSELLEDVYTYNDFTHTGANQALASPSSVAKALAPYLVTEHSGHMYPTRKNADEATRVEQALRHLRVIDSAYENSRIAGAIGWCFADYYTHKQFGANDRICYHGVMDMFRLPKYASYVYKSQRLDKPVLEVAGSMTPGEQPQAKMPETVVFTNCDYIKFYHNDYFIGKIYPEWRLYPNVLKPPVVIDDHIGDQIEVCEPYSKKVSRQIKKCLLAFSRYGMAMPFKYRLLMGKLMLINKITMAEATRLYGKYLGNWGDDSGVFIFEGYIDDELVIKKKIAQPSAFKIKVEADHHELVHVETYDVTRIVITKVDENDNILANASDVITIETDRILDVIGPKSVALIGGSTAFYVKTTGKKGRSKIKIKPTYEPDIMIEIDVK